MADLVGNPVFARMVIEHYRKKGHATRAANKGFFNFKLPGASSDQGKQWKRKSLYCGSSTPVGILYPKFREVATAFHLIVKQ